ncbi:PREDICTED: sucrase-isomaltase, intestinal-like [Papilio polytes]|uniref:sucrase-isomaltase, intestinal-like n=1 Tax=Papilio polytes TaxID=76194 RepID=UPI000676135E|nr:PREDICTED: sucrase-isomaltase, intestinal-like [Papilio polytes]
MIPRAEDISQDVREKKDENDLMYEYENIKQVTWYDQLLLNRPLKVVIVVLLLTIAAPLLIYQFCFFPSVDSPPSDGYSTGSCLLQRDIRLACGVGTMNEQNCHPQCCYDVRNRFCFHRLPSRFSYILDREWSENVTLQPRVSTTPYSLQNSLPNLRISVDEITSRHLSINFYNPQLVTQSGRRIENKDYNYSISSPELNIVVNSIQGNIFNTLRGPLIASNNIWEIAFKITNESMYGLGEIPLKAGTVKVIYNNNQGFSSVPLIFAKINESYHGLLLDSSIPTEVSILAENQIVVRGITSFGLKFHLFTGPRPDQVMKEVMNYIGTFKNFQYWMFGPHICSIFPGSLDNAFTQFSTFMNAASRQRLPFESSCGPIPIVFNSDQCDNSESDVITRGLRLIRRFNKRFMPHLSPYIRHEVNTTIEEEVNNTTRNCAATLTKYERYLLRDSINLDPYLGKIGNDTVVYPDYGTITEELIRDLWIYDTNVDGIILENNWPLDESKKLHNETYSYLPYFNKNFENALNRTPQWNISLPNDGGKYIFKHNMYGNNFINASHSIFDQTLSRWSSSHWMNGKIVINRQNVDTSWTSLHRELIAMALGGISGHWYWSSPVCGDSEDFNIEKHSLLCVKWYMAATFFPIFTINSKATQRDPIQFVGTFRTYINNSLNHRLNLLSYFYTTLQEGPLLRPMFYQYPEVSELKDVSTQFNVGEDLLIIPNLQPSQTHVHVWMPPGTWYELWSGLRLNASVGEAVTMTTTDADFLTLIRGGSIVPLQKDVKATAELTRLQSSFALTIALECKKKSDITNCEASGNLFMSPNMTIEFKADDENLYVTAIGDEYDIFCNSTAIWANRIQEINIYGLDDELNNYDNHRRILTSIDLCDLKVIQEIYFKFT